MLERYQRILHEKGMSVMGCECFTSFFQSKSFH